MARKLKVKTLAHMQAELDFQEEKRKEPARPPIPTCEEPACCNDGRFGFRRPGFAALREPQHFFCHDHRHLGATYAESHTQAEPGP